MQQNPENDLIYFLTSLEAAEKIILYSREFGNAVDFFEAQNQLHFNASLLLLATIGEQISKVSLMMRENYPNIEWNKIKAIRNRIVHDYAGVDFDLTFKIVNQEIPKLINELANLIKRNTIWNLFSRRNKYRQK